MSVRSSAYACVVAHVQGNTGEFCKKTAITVAKRVASGRRTTPKRNSASVIVEMQALWSINSGCGCGATRPRTEADAALVSNR